ncbi:hypothetical protein CEUSTIGMA_g4194.t1 [Chlamydomonas eustigma]|uniref:Uncharacterized protein n=1 Tax=Chlamydomonas eustigma TaxID=1157962 RepID=A0A250X0Z5_9CHLO|nr:hypothetical protein CEUSTIGMA_g4194.t1 [Chlamydomonas eustigma]|eukprot:GAX76747.1 hypothetical protein CEUSTIGMA_g4194.t1 [Chlamydomonas eustigma]
MNSLKSYNAGATRVTANRSSRKLVAVRAQETVSSSICSTCGAEKSEKACLDGRIIGGLAAIPGFRWWPIKAYRPCPNLSAAGLEYTRKGQAINDVLFGGVSLGQDGVKALDEIKKTKDQGLNVE